LVPIASTCPSRSNEKRSHHTSLVSSSDNSCRGHSQAGRVLGRQAGGQLQGEGHSRKQAGGCGCPGLWFGSGREGGAGPGCQQPRLARLLAAAGLVGTKMHLQLQAGCRQDMDSAGVFLHAMATLVILAHPGAPCCIAASGHCGGCQQATPGRALGESGASDTYAGSAAPSRESAPAVTATSHQQGTQQQYLTLWRAGPCQATSAALPEIRASFQLRLDRCSLPV
jgi:hypothetical protein